MAPLLSWFGPAAVQCRKVVKSTSLQTREQKGKRMFQTHFLLELCLYCRKLSVFAEQCCY